MLWLVSLASGILLFAYPVFADTSGPPAATRGILVPELRQRALSEAQKAAANAHLRLQVSGEAPADPSRVVVV